MKIILILLVMFILGGALLFAGGGTEQEHASGPPAAVPAAPERLSSEKLSEIIASADPNTYLVDVRTGEEFKSGAIPSAINIPFDVIADNLPTQDRSARIIVYCRSGNRSGVAYNTLIRLGFTNVLDFGGVGNWKGSLEVRE
jgi:rhodanese-related sulfurtransferase